MKTNTVYTNIWPARNQFPVETILFYDSVLSNQPSFKTWGKKFKHQFPLKAGESLKSLDSLAVVLQKMNRQKIHQTTALTFLAVGGGSVGDFVGFLASIFLRGRPLIHMPSTWLAAVDSAHGGKNGLNFLGSKNQLGTFYNAKKIILVKPLLGTQPKVRLHEAMGEVIKMSLINSRVLFENLEKRKGQYSEKDLFKVLPFLAQAKMKIVNQDPFEKSGPRRLLNLGHTVGHVLEIFFQIPHGDAVKLGILFSARWSFHLGLLKESDFIRISSVIESYLNSPNLGSLFKKISLSQLRALLLKDKKMVTTGEIDFIFIRKIGQVQRKKVNIQEILNEIQRQKVEF